MMLSTPMRFRSSMPALSAMKQPKMWSAEEVRGSHVGIDAGVPAVPLPGVVDPLEHVGHPPDTSLRRATRRRGNLWKTGDNRRSTVVNCEFIPNRAIATAKLASGAVTGAPPVPKCRQSGISASWAAARNGSQWSLWYEGRSSRCGASMKVMAFAPLAAVRSTSATEAATSQKGTMTIGIKRSGAAALHSSRMKSFHATTHAVANSLSCAAKSVLPANLERMESTSVRGPRPGPCQPGEP